MPISAGTSVPSLRVSSTSKGGRRPLDAYLLDRLRVGGSMLQHDDIHGIDLPLVQVIASVSQHLQEGVVRLNDMTAGIGHDDADDVCIDEPPQAGLALAQRLFGAAQPSAAL